MCTRLTLLAVLLAGLVLAGCEAEPPAEPVTPDAPPAEAGRESEAADTGLADAVAHTPADACGVVVVANMGDLEKNLKAVVGEAADEMNIVEELTADLPPDAFDAAGPLVMILPANLDEAEPVLVMAIKNADAIKGEDAGAGIVSMPSKDGRERFVLALDGWGLVSHGRADAIKAVMRAEKKLQLTGDQKTALADHMVWAHLNPQILAAMAKRAMAETRKQLQEAPNLPGQGASPAAALDMVDALLEMVKDVTAVEMAADVTPEGIHLTADAHLADGSPLAALAGTGVAMEDYTVGLPASDRLLIAAWAGLDWEKAIPPMRSLMKPILDTLVKGKDEATRKAIDDMWAAYEKWGPVMGNHFGMVMEVPKEGQGMYQLAETFDIEDPEAYHKLLKEYMDASKAFMDVWMTQMGGGTMMPGVAGGTPPMTAEMTYEEAAETIEGVSVDKWHMAFKVNLPDDAPPEAAEQVKQMIETIYGPDGMTFWMAVVGKKGVAVMGGKEAMARAIKAVKGDAPDLVTTEPVAGALGKIPEGRAAVLVSAANYAYMAMGMVDRMLAGQVPPEVLQEAEKAGHGPLQAPKVTDLVRMTLEGETGRLTLTVDVPKSDLQAAVDMFEKSSERMQFLMQKMQEQAPKKSQGAGKAQPQPQSPPKTEPDPKPEAEAAQPAAQPQQ